MTQTMGDRQRLSPALIAILIVVLTLFAGCAVFFASIQNVWVDETTQLSGATLGLSDLIGWLTGKLPLALGVPSDRMPPFSYFIDMIGWHIWGNSVLAFRLYHAVLVAAGIGFLLLATGRRFGVVAALIAGLTLVLSPKLIETAVEIRAYPIFFALSCAQVAMLVRGDVAARIPRLALFTALGIASLYTHFFGLVASSAFFFAAFVAAADRRAAIRVIVGYALLVLLGAGLAPFILGASSISTMTEPHTPGLRDLARYAVQMMTNSSILMRPAVAILYFAGAGLIALLALAGLAKLIARKGLAVRHDPAITLAVALLAGLVVTVGAGFLAKGFQTLTPRYSIWMFPLIAVLIGAAASGRLAPGGRFATWLRGGALAIFGAGALLALANFLHRADWFVHGPSTTLEAMASQGDEPVAIVHIGGTWAWGYFPLYWRHQKALPQWLLLPDGRSVARLDGRRDAASRPQPLSALDGYATLLVSRVDLRDYHYLLALNATPLIFPPASVAPALDLAGWTSDAAIEKPGNFNFIGQLYRKSAPTRPISPDPRKPD